MYLLSSFLTQVLIKHLRSYEFRFWQCNNEPSNINSSCLTKVNPKKCFQEHSPLFPNPWPFLVGFHFWPLYFTNSTLLIRPLSSNLVCFNEQKVDKLIRGGSQSQSLNITACIMRGHRKLKIKHRQNTRESHDATVFLTLGFKIGTYCCPTNSLSLI